MREVHDPDDSIESRLAAAGFVHDVKSGFWNHPSGERVKDSAMEDMPAEWSIDKLAHRITTATGIMV